MLKALMIAHKACGCSHHYFYVSLRFENSLFSLIWSFSAFKLHHRHIAWRSIDIELVVFIRTFHK